MIPILLVLLALIMMPKAAFSAEPIEFGSWAVGLSDDKSAVYAGTVNDSGSVLVENCSTSEDACYWILMTDSECKDGSQYPVLINSDASASAATVTCLGVSNSGKQYRYQFDDWKTLESTILKAKRVGFAFPLQSDQFTVVRFMLDGLDRASPYAERLAAEIQRSNKSNTRNTRL